MTTPENNHLLSPGNPPRESTMRVGDCIPLLCGRDSNVVDGQDAEVTRIQVRSRELIILVKNITLHPPHEVSRSLNASLTLRESEIRFEGVVFSERTVTQLRADWRDKPPDERFLPETVIRDSCDVADQQAANHNHEEFDLGMIAYCVHQGNHYWVEDWTVVAEKATITALRI